jgi:hypothetical protein
MKLPFEPESPSALRERFPAALDRVFDYREGAPAELPSGLRAHVFDFEDGVRMIVSRDMEGKGEVYLHVSASVEPGTRCWALVSGGTITRSDFRRLMESRFFHLSGQRERLEFCGFSRGKGVPHWRRLE